MTANTKEIATAILALTIDAIQRSNSGHPGMPTGMAEIGIVLWRRHLRHIPANPNWLNRDRLVLSNGHGSMLIYAPYYLSGYSADGRNQGIPHTAQQIPRASRMRRYPQRGNNDWPARARDCQCGRHRNCRKKSQRDLIAMGTRSSITTPMCSWVTAA